MGPCLPELEGRLAKEQRAGPNNGGHLELGRHGDENALEVAEGLDEPDLILVRHHDERQGLTPPLDERLRLLRRGRLEGRTVDEPDRPVRSMVRESATKRCASGLPVDLDIEAAHAGRKHHAAARELWSASRSLARPARSLLAPR